MRLALRIALPIGLAAHVTYFFYSKFVFKDFDFDDVLWNTGFAITSDNTEGWDYLFTVINGVWFFGLAFGTVAAFLLKNPREKVVYASDSDRSIPPGIDA